MLTIDFTEFPTMETDRLLLREVTHKDAEGVFSFRSNAQAMTYVPRPLMQNMDEAHNLIAIFMDLRKKNEAINWSIVLKEENKVIGNICIWQIQPEHSRGEVGYMILPEYWGKGLSTEAVKTVVGYGFNGIKLHSLEAIINPDNVASQRVLEKTGFVREAHFKQNFFHNGRFEDTAIYSILNPND